MFKSSIGHLCAPKHKRFNPGQGLELHKTGVGYVGFSKIDGNDDLVTTFSSNTDFATEFLDFSNAIASPESAATAQCGQTISSSKPSTGLSLRMRCIASLY